MKLARILICASLLLTLIPFANATLLSSTNEDEIARQLFGTGQRVVSQSCSNGVYHTTSSIPLEANKYYIYAMGVGGTGVTIGNAYLRIAQNDTVLIAQRMTSAMTTGGGIDASTVSVLFSGPDDGGNGFYNVTRFKMPYAADVEAFYDTSGGSCGTNDGFVVPPSLSSMTNYSQLMGFVGNMCANTCIPILSDEYAPTTELNAWTETQMNDINFFNCFDLTGTGTTRSYYLNATQKDVGGATYILLRTNDTEAASNVSVSSNIAGPAIALGSQFAGSGWKIDQYRLWYQDIPLNSSVSYRIDIVKTTANFTLQTCVLIAQPFHPHLSRRNFTGNLVTYDTFSVDSYHYEFRSTVTNTAGTVIPNVTYLVTANNTLNFTGTTESNGTFIVSSSGLRYASVQVILTADGYATSTYTFTMPGSSGIYFVNFTMSNLAGITITQNLITCTPSQITALIPNKANFTVAKDSRLDTAYYAVFEILPNGVPSMVTSVQSFSTTPVNIAYPTNRNSSISSPYNDTGAYLLTFSNSTGAVIKSCPFVINSANFTSTMPNPSDATTLSIMQQSMSAGVQDIVITGNQLTEKEEATNYILAATKWGFSSPILMPNMYWGLLIMAMVAILSAATRSRSGGQ